MVKKPFYIEHSIIFMIQALGATGIQRRWRPVWVGAEERTGAWAEPLEGARPQKAPLLDLLPCSGDLPYLPNTLTFALLPRTSPSSSYTAIVPNIILEISFLPEYYIIYHIILYTH